MINYLKLLGGLTVRKNSVSRLGGKVIYEKWRTG